MIVPTSVAEVRDVMREALAARDPVQISGAGTWAHGGAPVAATRRLSLRALSGIQAYVPGDLTITAWSGTSLGELAHATAAHGQWLGMDPAGSRQGTIGATVATASAGPLSHAFGTPRDLVLGLDAVTGYGDPIAPGGRVVKNVAGFDLVRLYIGSAGTLGPITSVSLRLRALPQHDVTLAVPAPPPALAGVLDALRQPTLSLLACEWVDAPTARELGLTVTDDVILVRLGGNDAFVRGQTAQLRMIGDVIPCDPVVWHRIATLSDTATLVVRVHGTVASLPTRLAHVTALVRAAATHAAVHARCSSGMIRVAVTTAAPADLLAALRAAPASGVVPEVLPPLQWRDEPDHFRLGLSGRIRDAFDPWHLCNRREVPDA
jgi:glycolate oxidase FAD binding subunit